MNQSKLDHIHLGASPLQIPRMGLGAWAWGDTFFWDYGEDFDQEDVKRAFHISLDAGVSLIDTAEIYAFGRSERMLGDLLQQRGANVQIATKFMPYPWRLLRGQLQRALNGSLRRLQLDRIDLYQIHHPLPFRSQRVWLEAMAEAVHEGRIGAIGVSNFNLDQTRHAIDTLAKHDLPLASNQVEYSLLDRSIEYNGLKQLCQDQNVTVIAYSPLTQGLLTGKYHEDNPPPGARRRRINDHTWQRLAPLMSIMKRIGQEHGDRTPAQVALNWVMAKGAVPIPGAKTELQAIDNASALEWELSAEEVVELDQLSDFSSESRPTTRR